VFSNLIELRGGSIVGHSRRVADLARRTATSMGLDATAAQDVFVAGLLHDIGHIALSDELLARPVPRMSADDLASYRRHPVLGEQSLLALEDMQRVAGLIRSHHERFDGQGFPDALRGTAIPLGARILAVADAFDDLQTGHLGSTGLTSQQAKTLVEHGRTRQFDPDVVTAFLEVIAPMLAAAPPRLMEVNADGLKVGMVLGRELRSREGLVLLAADHVLTADLIRRIRMYADREDIGMTLHVRAEATSPTG
jgi:response regulator RpfG family c-di-GMP phosphodiesterase